MLIYGDLAKDTSGSARPTHAQAVHLLDLSETEGYCILRLGQVTRTRPDPSHLQLAAGKQLDVGTESVAIPNYSSDRYPQPVESGHVIAPQVCRAVVFR